MTRSDRPMAGNPHKASHSPALLALLHHYRDSIRHGPESDSSFAFDPARVDDVRRRVLSWIVLRQGQGEFRQSLLKAYDGRCAITGCDAEAALDAAHIVPYRGEATNTIVNGLLLRADLHNLFDLGLIAIESTTMTVVVSPVLISTHYATYTRAPLLLPRDPADYPSVQALDSHRELAGI